MCWFSPRTLRLFFAFFAVKVFWDFLTSYALTFSLTQRIQDEQFASGAFGSSIGKPVRIRHGPATVIVEGWPECH